MPSKHRTHRMEKLARIYDAEILPVWSQKFGNLLMRGLKIPERAQILDVACGTGYPTTELIRRKGEGARLIAIEGSSALLDVARKKLEKLEPKPSGVFLRSQAAEPELKFADGVYDLVVCNTAVHNMEDPAKAISELGRVTREGGEVRVTIPVAGSFVEFFDIYREVLVKHDKHETAQRLRQHIDSKYPAIDVCERWLQDAGLEDVSVEVEEFTLLFRSSREFFFAPVIEFGPLAEWKAIAGAGQEMQDVFWYIKESIDAYFEGRPFEITIRAGLLRGIRSDAATVTDTATDAEEEESVDPGTRPGSDPDPDAIDIDMDEDTMNPDTLDPDTEDFEGTLEGLPYIKPLGDVEDTNVPGLPKRDEEE
ncbi:MAG: methyltransferase domain-containing protein [Deltaproteobacteria bacterium]|nr:methyltransferase domain-containing protein [Deltaproteobacteria bacterium]